MPEAERWKPIPGWEGVYEVSDRGYVRSLNRIVHRKVYVRHFGSCVERDVPYLGKVLSTSAMGDAKGRFRVSLSAGGRFKSYTIPKLAHWETLPWSGPSASLPSSSLCSPPYL